MLNDSDCAGETSLKMAERCKPDYETMILRLKEKVTTTGAFLEAALAYHKGTTARDKMAELIGELVTKHAAQSFELEKLMKLQEKEA